jgi:hypothetical protein
VPQAQGSAYLSYRFRFYFKQEEEEEEEEEEEDSFIIFRIWPPLGLSRALGLSVSFGQEIAVFDVEYEIFRLTSSVTSNISCGCAVFLPV